MIAFLAFLALLQSCVAVTPSECANQCRFTPDDDLATCTVIGAGARPKARHFAYPPAFLLLLFTE